MTRRALLVVEVELSKRPDAAQGAVAALARLFTRRRRPLGVHLVTTHVVEGAAAARVVRELHAPPDTRNGPQGSTPEPTAQR